MSSELELSSPAADQGRHEARAGGFIHHDEGRLDLTTYSWLDRGMIFQMMNVLDRQVSPENSKSSLLHGESCCVSGACSSGRNGTVHARSPLGW